MTRYATVTQRYLHGPLAGLRDATVDLDPLPWDLRLVDPADTTNLFGLFTGRAWLLDRVDAFVARCARGGKGYLVVEAEAGVGKSAAAAYLAFTRPWPAHVTRLGGAAPEAVRANLAAQLIARWGLADTAVGGVLPEGHDTPSWLHGLLSEAARARDRVEPGEAVVLLVDGADEGPAAHAGQMPCGLPASLPAGTAVVVTSRPGLPMPAAIETPVDRADFDDRLNRDDLVAYVRAATSQDQQLAAALARARISRDGFCRVLTERSAGVWIYALSVLDQIRGGELSAAEVGRLPAGLADYYLDNIVRWRADTGLDWESTGLPLMAALAAARRPQPVAMLASWAGVPPRSANKLLRGPFRPFVVRTDAGPDRYEIRHRSLRDLFEIQLEAVVRGGWMVGQAPGPAKASRVLAEATREAHGRIVASLPVGSTPHGGWDDLGDYARAFLPEHAARCGRLDEFVHDPDFLLLFGVPRLLRLRRYLNAPDARAAVAALDLASRSWAAGDRDDQLRRLEATAHALRATRLAVVLSSRGRFPSQPNVVGRARTGTDYEILTGHLGHVWTVAAIPQPEEGHLLASAGDDGTVRVWDTATGRPVAAFAGHTGRVWMLAVLPQPSGTHLLASADDEGTVLVRDPSTSAALATLTGHTGPINALAVLPQPDGGCLLATAGSDGTVRTWQPAGGRPLDILTGHDSLTSGASPVSALTTMRYPDGRYVLACAAGTTVRVRDPATHTTLATLTSHSDLVSTLAVVPQADGGHLLVSAGWDETVRVWDPAAGTLVATLSGHVGAVRALSVLPQPDGSYLLASAGYDPAVILWKVPAGRWQP